MMMLKDLELIASKLNEARSVLARTLDGLTEEQAVEVKITPEWSVKDEVAHLAGAERGMFGIAQRMARGEDPQVSPEYNNDFYNARQVAKRKEKSLVQVRAELDATHAELMTFLQNLTQEQLDLCGQHPLYGEVKLKELLVIIYSHETTHSKEISAKIREANK
jgi:uncharacterized damage-inducible protein DinB